MLGGIEEQVCDVRGVVGEERGPSPRAMRIPVKAIGKTARDTISMAGRSNEIAACCTGMPVRLTREVSPMTAPMLTGAAGPSRQTTAASGAADSRIAWRR